MDFGLIVDLMGIWYVCSSSTRRREQQPGRKEVSYKEKWDCKNQTAGCHGVWTETTSGCSCLNMLLPLCPVWLGSIHTHIHGPERHVGAFRCNQSNDSSKMHATPDPTWEDRACMHVCCGLLLALSHSVLKQCNFASI